jgi:hypothetical protein
MSEMGSSWQVLIPQVKSAQPPSSHTTQQSVSITQMEWIMVACVHAYLDTGLFPLQVWKSFQGWDYIDQDPWLSLVPTQNSIPLVPLKDIATWSPIFQPFFFPVLAQILGRPCNWSSTAPVQPILPARQNSDHGSILQPVTPMFNSEFLDRAIENLIVQMFLKLSDLRTSL